MSTRVVITGMGIVAPNGTGLENFEKALREGKSGIRFVPEMEELKFACQVGGIPEGFRERAKEYFDDEALFAMNDPMILSGMAGIDAWRDAGLTVPEPGDDNVDWDSGAIIGIGLGGIDTLAIAMPKIMAGKTRRLGSTMVEQIMSSSVSAKMSGLLGLGNQVTTNSSACSTGTEAIIMAYQRIKDGLATRMLAGGAESSHPVVWAGFDGMKVLNSSFNDQPEKASRPLSATAGGFIPGSGSGVLLLESLDSAIKRGARIYAEIIGGAVNSGGHRMGGSMTLPNGTGVQKCIKSAIQTAGIDAGQIDAINGHLTGTMADPLEVGNWVAALGAVPENFPYINATKSLVGHCLGAAGGVEGVASVLQVHKGFLHKSLNCEDIHEKIKPYEKSVVRETVDKDIRILAKASFGFGDVNATVIFKKYEG